ncbi:hypothetical protein J437_LFUL016571 [Ladona fulva]|uniref:Uncharacterized protein n=1 Tax=Ladona fulva TaxID=123851 RepID=A0A8K0KQ13_LADFU|nr:hypothetical protein J437_LFUL016571 [Ladona fulva]
MAESLEKVCVCPRELPQRILNICNDIFNKYIAEKTLHYFPDTPYISWFFLLNLSCTKNKIQESANYMLQKYDYAWRTAGRLALVRRRNTEQENESI